MPGRDPSKTLAWPPDPDMDTAIRVGWWGTFVGIVIFVVSLAGELLGWWESLGEVGIVVGTVLSIGLGVATWFSDAGRKQLSAVGTEVRAVGQGVRGVRDVHDAVLANGAQQAKLDNLDVIEQALVAADGHTSRLDIVQVQLDRQTGVLDRQLAVLGEIRDRL